jgi:glycosyltransferase involved in cell wall biosynthesis
MNQCNYCGSVVSEFLPYRGGEPFESEFIRKIDPIGSDIKRFLCPTCGCNDRERHLKMYLEALAVLNGKANLRILHFAPEHMFLEWLKTLNPEIHIFADLYSADKRFRRIDIQSIPYSDCSFDLVIANHVLEHVDDPEAALKEINRVLKQDGLAILQTPYSNYLEATFSDDGIVGPEDRLYFYGQEDHVRLFGKDIFDLYSKHLESKVVHHDSLFDPDVENVCGVNAREPLFLYGKKPATNQVELVDDSSRCPDFRGGRVEVSILCITYMHEEFIARALESFLCQRTTFNYEIVVGDDASTDRTLDIVRRYQEQFPEKVRLVSSVINLGPQKNFLRTLRECRGRYIALCEGDDYWTDVNKIQRQCDFLNSSPQFVMTYAGVQARQGQKIDYAYIGGADRDCSQIELLTMPPINTLTVMFRNVLDEVPVEKITSGAGDLFLWSILGHYGQGHYMEGILPSIYNVHPGGIHSMKSHIDKVVMQLMSCYSLFLYYKRINMEVLTSHFETRTRVLAEYVVSQSGNEGEEKLRNMLLIMREKAAGVYEFDSALMEDVLSQVGLS